jgi:hypothetical protein
MEIDDTIEEILADGIVGNSLERHATDDLVRAVGEAIARLNAATEEDDEWNIDCFDSVLIALDEEITKRSPA